MAKPRIEKALRDAAANARLEGIVISQETRNAAAEMLEGRISEEELIARIKAAAGKAKPGKP